jgi:ATP-dependent Clp protease, protease subunit
MSRSTRHNVDDTEVFFLYSVHIPTRTIYLGSVEYTADEDETGVDFAMAERFIKGLHILDSLSPAGDNPINIIMNNPGGDVTHGLAIYDSISACKSHVTIKVRGNACSMGGYILQAADERIMSPNSVFMFHAGYDTFNSNHPKTIKKWVKFNEEQGERVDKILLDKINSKRDSDNKPRMSKAYFDKLNDFDTILTPEETVDMGLADKIE